MARKSGQLPTQPRVALIVETSVVPGRQILRGIAQYEREHRPWSMYHRPGTLVGIMPHFLKEHWVCDGIIARVSNDRIGQLVRDAGVPAVDVLGMVNDGSIPLVHIDDRAVAHAAADHLIERGFRRFGFYGHSDVCFSVARRGAFEKRVSEVAEGPLCVFEKPLQLQGDRAWEDLLGELGRWLRQLPRPIGIMVATDSRGHELLEACRRAEITVPEEVSVISVDNDEPLCEVCNPALSSVKPDYFRVGYEAAALLERLMAGESPPSGPELIATCRVVTRGSTQTVAIDDPGVAEAVRFIREHACDGITVDDVVKRVPMSRSTLHRRMRAQLGRTAHDEIIRVRLDRARLLLAETDLPLQTIARRAGFNCQEYLSHVFTRKLGTSPGRYRKLYRDATADDQTE